MEKRFSEMSEYEIKLEIGKFQEKARKAEQMGMVSEYSVYERKIAMAKAYLLSPSNFQPGEVYEIDGAPGVLFKIDRLKGVFAWGFREGSKEEEGIPISLLIKPEK